MGASEWRYFVPYQEDLNLALRDLRQQVFSTGEYWWYGDRGTARFSRLPIGHPGLRGWRTCSKTRSFVRRGRTRSWTSSELSTLTGRGTGMTGARSFRLPPMRFELQSVRIDQPELILPSLMTSSLEPVGLVAARSFMTSTAIPLRSRSGDTPATDRRRGSCRLRFSDMRAVSAAIGAIR